MKLIQSILITALLVVFLPLVLTMVFLYWAFGGKIVITQKGKTIGHVKWLTYHATGN